MSKPKTNGEEKQHDLSAAGIIKLAEKYRLKLFHTSLRAPYATFWVNDHSETWPIKGEEFGMWLCGICYHECRAVPPQRALAEARNTLAGNALFASPEQRIFVRIAGHDGAIYLDLCNDAWEAVRITAQGWVVVQYPPIKFVRTPGMQALPLPVDGGRIDLLRPFLNVEDDEQWRLAVGFLVGALRPSGPFPLLVFGGTHDSAKSTCSRILRSLVDPNAAPLRSAPRKEHDLVISAANAWCLGFDNLSAVKPWLSDALCRISTGSGFATRALYTNDSERIFEGMRPVMLNGIEIDIERSDLLDRAIVLVLPPISDETVRRDERM